MVLFAMISIWACTSGETGKKAEIIAENNDKDLGLISADVKDNDKDLLGTMPEYSSNVPGTSKRIDRSFENAPPMIPHSTEGLIPITKDNNMCIGCHMPVVAAAMNATPIPVSHLTDYRPDVKLTTGKIDVAASSKVVEKDLDGKLNMARYNCTQCHVSQAKIDVVIQNKFETVFRNSELKRKSDLSNNIKEGVK